MLDPSISLRAAAVGRILSDIEPSVPTLLLNALLTPASLPDAEFGKTGISLVLLRCFLVVGGV